MLCCGASHCECKERRQWGLGLDRGQSAVVSLGLPCPTPHTGSTLAISPVIERLGRSRGDMPMLRPGEHLGRTLVAMTDAAGNRGSEGKTTSLRRCAKVATLAPPPQHRLPMMHDMGVYSYVFPCIVLAGLFSATYDAASASMSVRKSLGPPVDRHRGPHPSSRSYPFCLLAVSQRLLGSIRHSAALSGRAPAGPTGCREQIADPVFVGNTALALPNGGMQSLFNHRLGADGPSFCA
jgi:hypothetical protein